MTLIKNKRLHVDFLEIIIYICISVVSFYWAKETIARYDFLYYFFLSQIFCLIGYSSFGGKEGWGVLCARIFVIVFASAISNFIIESFFVAEFWQMQLRWLENELVMYGKGFLFSGLVFGGWLPAAGLAITKMIKLGRVKSAALNNQLD